MLYLTVALSDDHLKAITFSLQWQLWKMNTAHRRATSVPVIIYCFCELHISNHHVVPSYNYCVYIYIIIIIT